MRKLIPLAAALALASCAHAVPSTVKPGTPGLVSGLVQGFIAPVTFVISLFDPNTAVYAVPNDGHLYDLGFVLGIGGFGGLGFGGGRRRTRRY
jgi:hypothetical protein